VEQLEEMLRRTDEFLRDTSAAFGETGPEEARKIIDGAHRQQRRAWQAFRDQRPRLAFKLTLMAREAGRRALRHEQGVGPGDPAGVERELARTDRLIQEAERVLERGEGREALLGVLPQARRLQAEAWVQLRGARPGLAWRLSRQARLAVSRALGKTDASPPGPEVQSMIATTAELIDRLFEDAAGREQNRAMRRLNRAERILEEARAALREGKLRRALGSVRTASALALDVAESLEQGQRE
jgi:hypothetical protein